MKDTLHYHSPQHHCQRVSAAPVGRPRRDNEDDQKLKNQQDNHPNPPSLERTHRVLVQKKVMFKSYWDLKSEAMNQINSRK